MSVVSLRRNVKKCRAVGPCSFLDVEKSENSVLYLALGCTGVGTLGKSLNPASQTPQPSMAERMSETFV